MKSIRAAAASEGQGFAAVKVQHQMCTCNLLILQVSAVDLRGHLNAHLTMLTGFVYFHLPTRDSPGRRCDDPH